MDRVELDKNLETKLGDRAVQVLVLNLNELDDRTQIMMKMMIKLG